MASMADLRSATRAGRYVAARLPELPFRTGAFDLVLCSHLLFLYSGDLDLEMHLASFREMLRVGREVRIFPLLDLEGKLSVHLEPTLRALLGSVQVEVLSVPFEFQRGGSRMLRLTRPAGRS